MGLEDMTDLVDTVTDVMNSWYFDKLLSAAGFVGDHIPDWVLEKLSDYLYEKYGIRLSKDELKKLLSMIGKVSDDLDTMEDPKDGGDLEVESIGNASFSIQLKKLEQSQEELASYSQLLREIAEEVGTLSSNLTKGLYLIKIPLGRIKSTMEEEARSMSQLGATLIEIKKKYDTTEKTIVDKTVLL